MLDSELELPEQKHCSGAVPSAGASNPDDGDVVATIGVLCSPLR